MQISVLHFNARTCGNFRCSHQYSQPEDLLFTGGRFLPADNSSLLSPEGTEGAPLLFPALDWVSDACLPHSSQCRSHSLTQTLSRGLTQACTDPESQVKHCMNSLGGREQSCSFVLSHRLALSGSEHPLSSFVCKA